VIYKIHNNTTFWEQLASCWKGKENEGVRNLILNKINEVER